MGEDWYKMLHEEYLGDASSMIEDLSDLDLVQAMEQLKQYGEDLTYFEEEAHIRGIPDDLDFE